MKSSLLTLFYLAKDAVHRWKTHCSSPLARVLVVFFLTLCALIVLANFIVMTSSVEREIARSGGNLLVVSETIERSRASDGEFSPLLESGQGFRVSVFNEVYTSAQSNGQFFPIAEYPLASAHLFADLAGGENGVFVLPKEPVTGAFPREVEIGGWQIFGTTIPAARAGILANLYQSGAVFVPEGMFGDMKLFGFQKKTVVATERLDAAQLRELEMKVRNLLKLDKRSAHVQSSRAFLERLERIRRDQLSWRIAISLGIAFIVGVLLTSISSMEFQRNEYVYALMSSFGVSRILLILAFIAENLILVFAASAAAFAVFVRCIPLILDEVFKVRGLSLDWTELAPDLRLIAFALCVCVLISSIPIAAAALRPIGKVLK